MSAGSVARRGPEPAGSRLRRLLILLPWLMDRGQVPVDEAAARFGVSREQLIRDVELAAMCGLPPYIDEMIDLFIEQDVIYAGVPRLFTRPLRMTAREAFSLLAAGRAALELPGAEPDGPLARALDKVEAALGGSPLLRVDVPRPPLLDAVQEAVDARHRLRITYFVANRGERTERTVDPIAVIGDRGHWYLQALDHGLGEDRWFRIDRIDVLTPTGELSTAELPAAVDAPDWLRQFSDATVVRLRIPRAGAWMTERYPVISVASDGGDHLLVDLPVLSRRWLERLLLRLGPGAEVLEPDDLRRVGADAAQRVLARYA
jgi:predicted DNA-binding transcriptional regulator YafY